MTCFQSIRLADFRIGEGAWTDGTFLRGAIDGDEAEAEPVAIVPFEVIEERPVEIAAYVGAVCDSAVDSDEGCFDEFLAHTVLCVGETVFGDVDRFAVRLQLDERLIEALRIELPAEISDTFIRILAEAVVDDVAMIIIETDEVLAVSDAVEEPLVPEIVADASEYGIDERRTEHLEGHLVFGDADQGIGNMLLDDTIGTFVSGDEIAYDAIV